MISRLGLLFRFVAPGAASPEQHPATATPPLLSRLEKLDITRAAKPIADKASRRRKGRKSAAPKSTSSASGAASDMASLSLDQVSTTAGETASHVSRSIQEEDMDSATATTTPRTHRAPLPADPPEKSDAASPSPMPQHPMQDDGPSQVAALASSPVAQAPEAHYTTLSSHDGAAAPPEASPGEDMDEPPLEFGDDVQAALMFMNHEEESRRSSAITVRAKRSGVQRPTTNLSSAQPAPPSSELAAQQAPTSDRDLSLHPEDQAAIDILAALQSHQASVAAYDDIASAVRSWVALPPLDTALRLEKTVS